MNVKLQKALSDKVKDMGLSRKAIDRLVEIGGEGLADDASDEDITAKVEMLVPFAKEMQAEVTRKTKKAQSAKQSDNEGDGEGENKGDETPEWAKAFQTRLDALEKENRDLKAEKAQTLRAAEIADKAKMLGIPDYLIKRVSFPDDADLDTELANFKQELVNNNLVPKGQAHEPGSTIEAMKADAKSWAEGLPDIK